MLLGVNVKKINWQEKQIHKKVSPPQPITETLLLAIELFRTYWNYLELFGKIIHEQTQNVNELLNEMIWQKYPKNYLISGQVLHIVLSSAVLKLNHGPGNIS